MKKEQNLKIKPPQNPKVQGERKNMGHCKCV